MCCNFLGSSPPKNQCLEYDPVGFQPVAELLVSGRDFFAFHVVSLCETSCCLTFEFSNSQYSSYLQLMVELQKIYAASQIGS